MILVPVILSTAALFLCTLVMVAVGGPSMSAFTISYILAQITFIAVSLAMAACRSRKRSQSSEASLWTSTSCDQRG